jgi:uncharacterized membrane protein (DUF2068 family)
VDIPHLQQPVVPKRGVLIWIAVYKIVKAALTLIAGIAMLRLRHHDVAKVLADFVHHLGVAPDSGRVTRLLARVSGINDKQLGEISAGLFLYAILYFVEGIGLYFEKEWAEWLIVIASALLLPLEVYELFVHPHWLKVGVLLTNLLIIAYLVWRLLREKRIKQAAIEQQIKRDAAS